MEALTTYTYADGSGNRYHLHGHLLRYVPVQPHQSSSGVYSGGAPWARELAPAAHAALAAAFEAALADTSAHQPDRGMGSGWVLAAGPSGERQCILAMRSPTQQTLEQALGR
ncbi:MAG: hypothetical protein OHK0039_28820 [Bacteroidia bacterium]